MLFKAGALALTGAGLGWWRDRILWPDPKVQFADGAVSSGWRPFSSRTHRVVIVDAVVNGAPVRALVDSGAQSSVIDAALAQRLGLKTGATVPVVALGVSGEPQLGRTAVFEVQLGALSFRGLRAAVLDLGGISSASGLPFSLILGQDVLRQVVADFDFPRQRLSFHRPDAYVLPESAMASPARRKGRELVVPVMVEGAPLEVALDTGASGSLSLSSDVAEGLGLLAGRPIGWGRSISFGGVSRNRVVAARTLSFAGRDYRDVPVDIYPAQAGGLIPEGLLGVEMLERYRVIIDHGRGRLHLVGA